jgi:glycosyltransferase involved in cell wall biosynthesis
MPEKSTANTDNSGNSPGLRILQINSVMTGGGTDDQALKLAHGLHQAAQQVWVAGPEGRECARVIRDLNIPFHATPPEGFARERFILATARFIREQKMQIVHGHHGRDLWPTILAARLSGVRPKIVLTRHLAYSPGSWASRHFLLSQCDACVAVSEFVARVMREGVYEPDATEEERRARAPIGGDHSKIRVIYGGIDTSRFRPGEAGEMRRELGLAPEHYAFAVVGTYHLPRGKGQREFLMAAARIHQEIPNARFLIIGRGDMGELLQADIARLGLAGKAWLTRYASDMPQVMNAIDCLVHPPNSTEALGLVVCEAHACGKPVIASAIDGLPEAFAAANYGRLVPPDDVAALAGAMASQAREPKLGPAQAEEMHRRVGQTFSLEQMAAKILRLYRSLSGINE